MNPLCYVLSFGSRFRRGSRKWHRFEETYYPQVYIHHKTYRLGLKWAEKDPNVEKQLTSPGCRDLDCTAPQIKLAAAENAKRAAAKAVI